MTPSKYLFFYCIVMRFLIVYTAIVAPTNNILRLFSLVVGTGFMYYFLSGTRTTGPETFGKPIWWNHLRPIHSFNYLCYLVLSYIKPDVAYIPLLIDVMIGVYASCTN